MKQAINKVKSMWIAFEKWGNKPVFGIGYIVTTDIETNTNIYSDFKIKF